MIELWKLKARVARAETINVRTELEAPDLYHGTLELFYFNTITLAPVVAFEHIAGVALVGFLDRCSIHGDDLVVPYLRYVHGKSEVMKGQPKISSVLLAQQKTADIPDPEFAQMLPEIWYKFQALRAQENI
jgi:hypothetical protein